MSERTRTDATQGEQQRAETDVQARQRAESDLAAAQKRAVDAEKRAAEAERRAAETTQESNAQLFKEVQSNVKVGGEGRERGVLHRPHQSRMLVIALSIGHTKRCGEDQQPSRANRQCSASYSRNDRHEQTQHGDRSFGKRLSMRDTSIVKS